MAKKTENNLSKHKDVILITRFSALGDVAMTLPPIYDACLSNPDKDFVMVTRHHPAKMFINPPANLTIHPVDTDKYAGIGGLRRLYRELRDRYGITAYADLHDVLRTKVLRTFFRLGGAKVVKVDKDRHARRRLTRTHHKHLIPLRPMGLRYADTLRAAGAEGKGLFRSIFPSPPDPALFAKATPPKQNGEIWIGIAPFARHAGKIYPANLMKEVIDNLLTHDNIKIFVFGFGKSEEEVIEGWKHDRVVNMAKCNIGLPAELALLSYCDSVLSMDSANMHLGVLAGTRVVSIWGATHPYCGFRPSAVADEDIIQLEMVCRPCSVFGNKKCRFGDYHCLNGISPARVTATLLKV